MINLLEKYKQYKVGIEGKNPKSIDDYIYRIQDFFDMFNITNDENLINITAEDVQEWLLKLSNKGNSAQTRNAKLTAIKSIIKFLKDYKQFKIDENILKIKNAKVPKKEMRFLDKKEARAFIESITNQRTKAGAIISLTTGLRFSEMITLTVTDIKRKVAVIKGKGNKERTIYFTPYCLNIVEKYINKKRKHIIERYNIKSDLLFISDMGHLMRRDNYAISLKHYAKKMGIDWASIMSPHKLRHSFASIKGEEGYDVTAIADALGHESIATTNRYLHAKQERVRSMMESDSFASN